VLAGESLIVAIDEPGGDEGLWVADGELVRYVVSVASRVEGAGGLPFLSDLAVSNALGLAVDGWARFVPEGEAWEGSSAVPLTLAPGETRQWTDALDGLFGRDDDVKGSILVGGFPQWALGVNSRNYSIDDQGRQYGISVPGFSTFDPMTGGTPWIISGLRHDDRFRSNLIVAGATEVESTVHIRLMVDRSEAGRATRTVPAYGLLQINGLAPALGLDTVDAGYVEITVRSGGVFAALSVVDGSSEDASFLVARPLLR